MGLGYAARALRAAPDDMVGPVTEPADADRIAERAHLLPEEIAAGSDDPEQQAEAILAESDRRTDEPQATRDESSQTPGH